MQINMDTRNNSQSFTAFKLCSGAESQLKKVLKPKDWVKFNEIIDEQLSNPVDINLFAHSGDKFYGRIVTKNNYVKGKDIYQYPFFESAISHALFNISATLSIFSSLFALIGIMGSLVHFFNNSQVSI